MPILDTQALTRSFDSRVAVDGISLAVEPGEVFGLLGPNGAGKTTTIKMLTTLLPPTSGTAHVAGFDIVRQSSAVRRVIGYVPQLISADGALTGFENLLIWAKLYELPRRERRARVDESLAFMGLSDAADKLVNQYSGGMIRRLEIAQSMLHRPPVLFLDEPTVGLDPLARGAVWQHILRLRDEHQTTIFCTTHLMDEADTFCNRVAIMNVGKIAAIGSPEALRNSLGAPDATLDDVFIHYSGNELQSEGTYRDISRARRTARRLG